MTKKLVSWDDATGHLPAVVETALLTGALADGAVAAIVGNPASATSTELSSTYAPRQFLGMTFPSLINDLTALQAAATVAATDGTKLVTVGVITTNQTLTINSHADLTGLTINYTGTGIAVVVGKATADLNGKNIKLPFVHRTTADLPVGTIGVKLVNVNSCLIDVLKVELFETGLLVYGEAAKGSCYNTINLGHLNANKRNLQIDADINDGWANQNTFIGGRFSHNSATGIRVPGFVQILITDPVTHLVNNNTFIGCSLEGDVAEYIIDCDGVYNVFTNCRYEVFDGGDPQVRWGARSFGNVLSYGYHAARIVETHVAGSACNQLFTFGHNWLSGDGYRGTLVLESNAGTSTGAMTVMENGARQASADPDTDWVIRANMLGLHVKSATAAYRKLSLNTDGSISFGSGSEQTPPRKLVPFSTTGIAVTSSSLIMNPDNTNDFGDPAFRARDVYAGRALKLAGKAITYGAAVPTTGAHVVGSECKNSAPAVGQPKAWLCTVAGGSHGGTWAPTTVYVLGDWRRTAAGRVLECTTAGTSGATEPTPITGTNQVIAGDGTAGWTVRSMTLATWVSTGNL